MKISELVPSPESPAISYIKSANYGIIPCKRAGSLAPRSEASGTLALHSRKYYSDARVNDPIGYQLVINPYFLHSDQGLMTHDC